MTQSSVAYFVLVRGFLGFGVLVALIYMLLNVLMDGASLSRVRSESSNVSVSYANFDDKERLAEELRRLDARCEGMK